MTQSVKPLRILVSFFSISIPFLPFSFLPAALFERFLSLILKTKTYRQKFKSGIVNVELFVVAFKSKPVRFNSAVVKIFLILHVRIRDSLNHFAISQEIWAKLIVSGRSLLRLMFRLPFKVNGTEITLKIKCNEKKWKFCFLNLNPDAK